MSKTDHPLENAQLSFKHDAMDAGVSLKYHPRGGDIYQAGQQGAAWRVCLGAVRLDQACDGETRFAGVAVAGDIIGAETLLFGRYTYTARALSAVTLEPWSDNAETLAPSKVLQAFTQLERRAADTLALRNGAAEQRIGELLNLIGRGLAFGKDKVRVALPTLRDIAEMTGLTIETVSRTIKSLRHNGSLDMVGERRAREVWIDSHTDHVSSNKQHKPVGTVG